MGRRRGDITEPDKNMSKKEYICETFTQTWHGDQAA